VVAAVPGGIDVRIAGAAELVDDDAIVALEPGHLGQLRGRQDADADDHQVRGQLGAGGAFQHEAVAAGADRGDAGLQAEPHAGALVGPQVEVRDRWRHRAGHDAIGDLHHRDLESRRDGHRCHLQADIAAADHHQAPARLEPGLDGAHVVDGAQVVDLRQVLTRNRDTAHVAAGGEDQLAVARRVAADGNGAPPAVDGLHAYAEPHVHMVVLVELPGAQVQPLEFGLAGEELLRQRRALVGQVGLLAGQDDVVAVAAVAQRYDGLGGRLAGSGDDNGIVHGRNLRCAALIILTAGHRPGKILMHQDRTVPS